MASPHHHHHHSAGRILTVRRWRSCWRSCTATGRTTDAAVRLGCLVCALRSACLRGLGGFVSCHFMFWVWSW